MTEPNLNSQIVDIINNFLQDNKLVDARTCEGEFLGMHSSLTVGGAHEVVEELEKLISDQVAKAKIDERDNAWKSFHKAYDNGDKAGDYIIKGVMKKVHANNRKFRVECYWCGGVMYRYSNKFKVKHIMCSCWRDEEKRADRIATPPNKKEEL